MAELDNIAERMLATDCGHSLEELARKATAEDLAALVRVIEENSAPDARKIRAMFVLGRMNKKEAVQPILKALPKLDTGGKLAAADALGRLGGAKARGELVKMTAADDAQIRKVASQALARIGDKAAMDRLKEIAESDAEAFVRRAARKKLDRAK
ncbi:HEAT repeat domain-containing protein [Roseovarius sp. SK2]|jgi:HEAT repeat protein|uniref:HEAT repeat domain-containing protein n=1 Tax=Roseovarius TaxID=74030 RepID=UPI001473C78A|nr:MULTISPECIES: HEAT repeat domain-containing protein [Roseovarius]MDD9723907.1 HEAT repeat domain-containing protein [Roseovarius sp. SK2]